MYVQAARPFDTYRAALVQVYKLDHVDGGSTSVIEDVPTKQYPDWKIAVHKDRKCVTVSTMPSDQKHHHNAN